jgi:hypothetical protein
MNVTLRPGNAEDARPCGAICYEAFKTVAEQHNFPPDSPSAEVATELLAGLLAHPGVYAVVAEGVLRPCRRRDERRAESPHRGGTRVSRSRLPPANPQHRAVPLVFGPWAPRGPADDAHERWSLQQARRRVPAVDPLLRLRRDIKSMGHRRKVKVR